MSRAPSLTEIKTLNPEKVAYWYFRLNGYLQIENFVVHPERRGGQRTNADVLAVRFPFRAERLFDDSNDIMADDEQRLALPHQLIDIVIAEVKTNQTCTLNDPWTRQDPRNVHRVLAAIGCLPHDQIDTAAADIYQAGSHRTNMLCVRLIAVGRDRSGDLAREYPEVIQLLWAEMLEFIWHRFNSYRHQKTQVNQWDQEGLKLKWLADEHRRSCEVFVERTLSLIGVRNG